MAVLMRVVQDDDGGKLAAVLRFIVSAMESYDYRAVARFGNDGSFVFAARFAIPVRRHDGSTVFVYAGYRISVSRRVKDSRNYVARIIVRRGALGNAIKAIVVYINGSIPAANEHRVLELLQRAVEKHFTVRRDKRVVYVA